MDSNKNFNYYFHGILWFFSAINIKIKSLIFIYFLYCNSKTQMWKYFIPELWHTKYVFIWYETCLGSSLIAFDMRTRCGGLPEKLV